MKVKIIYIYHNCFILKTNTKTFLFDYPADRYLSPAMRRAVIDELRGSKVFFFSSHNHQDHFNSKITDLVKVTSQGFLILSHDIFKAHPKIRNLENCTIMNPGEIYDIDEIKIETFLSNDSGVAFLVQSDDLTIYFGGDLAKWSWDDFTPEERHWMETQFQNTISYLAKQKIDIAFENTDQRLSNWAGAAEFIQIVKPNLFVPMHTFGNTGSLQRFIADLDQTGSKIFMYRETGDQIEI